MEKYNFKSELIIVEWNPIEEKERLKDALNWPKNLKSINIRIIEVPNRIHKQFPNSNKIPVFEFLAKNVGIRRARGEYVLATNADILFNEFVIQFLSSKKLTKDCFYRIDRHDLGKIIPLDLSVQEQLKQSKDNVYRIAGQKGTLYCNTKKLKKAKFNVLKCIFIIIITRIYMIIKKVKLLCKKLISSYENNILYLKLHKARIHSVYRSILTFFLSHPIKPINKKKSFLSSLFTQLGNVIKQAGLHTNASGDFFLMAKQHWIDLKGFPELMTSQCHDSYMCFMAYVFGLKQIILKSPLEIYHQIHDQTEALNRPTTDWSIIGNAAKKMINTGEALIINNENWGLGDEKFSEYEIPH